MERIKKVLLFEFKFHQEIIPSQIKFLLSRGYEVHLFLDKKLWDDYLFECFRGKVNVNLFTNSQKWYKKLVIFFTLQYYVRVNSITHVVVNTLDSTFGSLIIKNLFNVYKVGVVHRVQDIEKKSGYHANVKRMDGVLTLSDHTYDFLVKHYPWIKKASYFYPVFFCQEPLLKKPESSEINVIIPGQLSYDRRDYKGLLAAIRSLGTPRSPIRFFLLGDARKFDGPAIVNEITGSSLQDYFYFAYRFVPYNEFIHMVREADYVMPLLSAGQENSQYYMQSQISAASNWALGFRKPILLHESFKELKYISDNALYYSTDSLPDVLRTLNKPSHFRDVPELTFSNQANCYFRSFDE